MTPTITDTTGDGLKARVMRELLARREPLQAQRDQLYAQLDAVLAQMAPLKDREREIRDAIRAANPDIADMERLIGAVSRESGKAVPGVDTVTEQTARKLGIVTD